MLSEFQLKTKQTATYHTDKHYQLEKEKATSNTRFPPNDARPVLISERRALIKSSEPSHSFSPPNQKRTKISTDSVLGKTEMNE